ncbi:hypothetical protein B0E53_06752 [Micromonospora sp. MH33]|nr:hypothetical protein B0E53_06752 [Micromonospora sp. MH33]
MRLSKYSTSSTVSALTRSSLMDRIHFDRNRVSNEKNPVGMVGDASMSPVSSLTTNVLPSSSRTRPSLMPHVSVRGRSPEGDGLRAAPA